MNTTEASSLLAICSSFDNRKPNPETVTAWLAVMGDLRFEDCRDAVLAHYATSREWIMPADIRTAVKRLRAKRIAQAGDPTPPPDLTPLETVAWLKERNRRVGNGETAPDGEGYGVIESRNLPQLRAFVAPRPRALHAPKTDRPRVSCEGQATHDGGVVLCGLPATTTATTDTGRAYPTCAEHGERESA